MRGVAIPSFWQALNKAGNATAEKHIEIIKRFVEVFGVDYIAGILAGREFSSHKLFP